MGDSYYYTCPALPCSRKHSLSEYSNHFVTQEAPMGDSWVIPSVTSLTKRSVHDKELTPVIKGSFFNFHVQKFGIITLVVTY